MKRRRPDLVPATPERLARGEVMIDRIAITDANGKVTGTTEGYRTISRLERMRRRNEITEREYQAGCVMLNDLADMEASMRSCLNGDTGGDAIMAIVTNGFRMTMASNRLKRAVQVLGPQMADLVRWVGRGHPASDWARANGLLPRSGADLLGLALRRLADHYGLDSDCQSR